MASALYFVVITALLLFALALTIPVVIDILREGIQHQGAWRFRDQSDEQTRSDNSATAVTDMDEAWTCSNCGATNDPEFTYCQRCAERL